MGRETREFDAPEVLDGTIVLQLGYDGSVTVLCVGKLKEKFYQEAAAEYAKRLGRHCKLEIIELPESRLPEDPSAAEIQRALAADAF